MLGRAQGEKLLEVLNADWRGSHPSSASAFVVALHWRGANSASILELTDILAQPDTCFIAPEAEALSWYPHPFTAPLAANEPQLGQSLSRVSSALDAIEASGVETKSIGLLGFSQGACLAIEIAVRRPKPYGAVIGLSGGFIGPLGVTRLPNGRLDGTHVLLGCSDVDTHIPFERVRATTELFRLMGAVVDERIYNGFGHGVNEDEILAAQNLLRTSLARQS
jgi:phospholipase/carboxylesterase